jgi:hypothetical protein
MVKVVVAHSNENLDWIQYVKYETIIISKANIPPEVVPNKGNEASSYLKYIIDNYDNLDDYTIFVHGHRTHWHHTSNIDEKINNIDFVHDYYNINEVEIDKLHYALNSVEMENKSNLLPKAWNSFINETGISVDYIKLGCITCAQFYVNKNLILKHPREEYIKMYNWLMNSNIISFWTGRVFEHSWHYIFTSNLEDRL